MTYTSVFAVFFLFIACLWLLSVVKKDASIIDRFWGLFFVILACLYGAASESLVFRSYLTLFLVSIWGLRLSLYLHLRNSGHGEDFRYQKMRQKRGKAFWWQSFFTIYLLQGVLAIVVSLPLFATLKDPGGPGVGVFDVLGLLVFSVGLLFEVGGDYQLSKFKKDPANKGKLLTSGLWSLTRHPNYFGDACVFWGFYLISLSSSFGWAMFIGPLVMTIMLRYISGAAHLEKSLSKTKPGYKEYVENTPCFMPKWGFGKKNTPVSISEKGEAV